MKYLRLFEEFETLNEAESKENIRLMFSEDLLNGYKPVVSLIKTNFKFYLNRTPFGQFGITKETIEDQDFEYLNVKIFGTDEVVTFYGIDISGAKKNILGLQFSFDWDYGAEAIETSFKRAYNEMKEVIEKYKIPTSRIQGFDQRYNDFCKAAEKNIERTSDTGRKEIENIYTIFVDADENSTPIIERKNPWGNEKYSIFPNYFDFIFLMGEMSAPWYSYASTAYRGGYIQEFGVKNAEAGKDGDIAYDKIKDTPEYQAILDLGFVKDDTTPIVAKNGNMRFSAESDVLNLKGVTAYGNGPVRSGNKPPAIIGSGSSWAERLKYVRDYFLKQMITYIVAPKVEPKMTRKTINELGSMSPEECYQELLEKYTAGFMYWMNNENKDIADKIIDKIDIKGFIEREPEEAIVALKKYMNVPYIKKAFQEAKIGDSDRDVAADLEDLSDLGF